MNYRYSIIIQWSNEDNHYLVHLPEFPWQQFHTHGETYEEVAKHGQEVTESLIEWFQSRAGKASTRTNGFTSEAVKNCIISNPKDELGMKV